MTPEQARQMMARATKDVQRLNAGVVTQTGMLSALSSAPAAVAAGVAHTVQPMDPGTLSHEQPERPVRGETDSPDRAQAAGHPGPAQLSAETQDPDRAAEGQLPHSELQEFETLVDEGPAGSAAQTPVPDYEPGVSTVEGESRPEFRITVTLLVSNRGRRDPTGALETLMDTLTATRRRLSQRLAGRVVEGEAGPARPRRGHYRNTKAVGKVPF